VGGGGHGEGAEAQAWVIQSDSYSGKGPPRCPFDSASGRVVRPYLAARIGHRLEARPSRSRVWRDRFLWLLDLPGSRRLVERENGLVWPRSAACYLVDRVVGCVVLVGAPERRDDFVVSGRKVCPCSIVCVGVFLLGNFVVRGGLLAVGSGTQARIACLGLRRRDAALAAPLERSVGAPTATAKPKRGQGPVVHRLRCRPSKEGEFPFRD
jgi:hypothetical protein